MPRNSKRPSTPRPAWTRPTGRKVVLSDDVRVPFPGVVVPTGLAAYVITPLGHVYRDDGRLLLPSLATGELRLNGGKFRRKLSVALHQAFGRVTPPSSPRWDLWIPYGTPDDPVTGRRRCYVTDLFFVPRAELIALGQYGRQPKTLYRIV